VDLPDTTAQVTESRHIPCTGLPWAGIAKRGSTRRKWAPQAPRRTGVKELIKYLIDNLYLDFQGEISLETVRNFLREDDGREARQLLSKLIEEKGVDDMLITLADCLKEHIQSGINEKTVREQLSMYSES
jgi:hypothetical protein